MATQEIFCTVNSCYYYASGDKCAASKIMVRNNPTANRDVDMEVGEIGSQASQSNETLCETFVPKHQGPKPGIARIQH